MMLWHPSQDPPRAGNLISAEEAASKWKRISSLGGHTDDVMDLAWSPDGTALLSGSIDNRVIVWEVSDKKRGAMITQFTNHKHFVQGVAWDPAQQYIISQSADRSCKVYALRPPAHNSRKNKVSQYMLPACETAKELYPQHTMSKRVVPVSVAAATTTENAAPAPTTKADRVPLFLDESAPTFFRRPAWAPDGSFVAIPAGVVKSGGGGEGRDINTAYLYQRGHWTTPIMHLPCQNKPVVAVRFCPVLFRLPSSSAAITSPAADAAATTTAPPPFDKLPYKMVFAIATLDSVVLYDTTSFLPLGVLGNLHYDSITDLAWSPDGRFLAVSSRDCYCSIAAFAPGELGEPLPVEELPSTMTRWEAVRDAMAEAAKVAAAKREARQKAKLAAAAAATPAVAAPAPAAGCLKDSRSGEEKNTRKKRIAPEMIGSSAAGTGTRTGIEEETGGGSGGSGAKKQKKRITPQQIVDDSHTTPMTLNATTIAAVTAPAPTATVGKRITPSPVVVAKDAAVPVMTGIAKKDHSKRRIVPIPVDDGGVATTETQQKKETTPPLPLPSSEPKASPPPPQQQKPGGIAAMLAAAGAQAGIDALKKKK